MHASFPVILLFALLGVFMVWRVITRMIRRLSRMTDTIPADAGAELRRSGWGNAVINGSRATNSIRVVEYVNGHAVQMHPVFGGALLWLPKAQTTQQNDGPDAVQLNTGHHTVTLSGKLAAFMRGAAGQTQAPTSGVRHAAVTDHSQATALATGVKRLPRDSGSSLLGRLAIWSAIALLAFVLVRRTAPDLVAPLEHWIGTLLHGR
ncbi:hypothetical protein [Denitromonas iodatirespirans]|uniref:Uncharacterized protein n=1 Tax=Denitromonas iodatirespirans TaxID=2795389 RepID=A0A944H6Z1_DENI1|nr:hypothetical protein [Denitromonas iodatirespirans]MBT0960654.1 hypothetical protein [Denitromonas iodatirespirans]